MLLRNRSGGRFSHGFHCPQLPVDGYGCSATWSFPVLVGITLVTDRVGFSTETTHGAGSVRGSNIGISELVFTCCGEYPLRVNEPTTAPAQHAHSPLPDRVLDLDDAQHLAERFKLLSDPSRLRIVYALLDGGELCVRDLAGLVELSESATSHHLRQLRLVGLVKARKQGREVFYRIADSHVRLLLDVAVEHYLHGHEKHR